jgi:hypothetical protein
MHNSLDITRVNRYLAHKQRLLPGSRAADVMHATRDIVALHATGPAGPYLSLWARMDDFERAALEDLLYERRELARVICMRSTLHLVPTAEFPLFFQAYIQRVRHESRRRAKFLLEGMELAQSGEAESLLELLHARVLEFVRGRGVASAQEINRAVPELGARYTYAWGKSYVGEFSIGTRILGGMCDLGLLVRARPRGTWQSSLYEYAPLSDWLPDVVLDSVTADAARSWLVGRYLTTFGPATLDDAQWWTGLPKARRRRLWRDWVRRLWR